MHDAEIPIGVLGTPEEVAETVLWLYVSSGASIPLFQINATAGVARSVFCGDNDMGVFYQSRCLVGVLYFIAWESRADSGTSHRVKTGYVTNKVIGVDGGMFPQ